MKPLRALVAISLLFSAGCANIKTTGNPLYKNGESSKLDNYLYAGLGKLTKKQVGKKIDGNPEIFITEKSEQWTYRATTTKSKLKVRLLNTIKVDNADIQELVIFFNKKGVLTNYQIRNQSDETVEKSDYAYKMGDGMILGIISGIVFAAINNAIGRAKK